MNEEILTFLKENLKIEIGSWGNMCESGYEVRLLLCGEMISSDRITTEISE